MRRRQVRPSGPGRAGLPSGIAAWYRQHRVAATIGVVGAAALLVGVAAILVWRIAREAPAIGTAPSSAVSASVSPTVRGDSSASPAPSQAQQPSTEPSAAPSGSYPTAGFAPLPPSWGVVMVNDLNVRSGPEDDDPVVGLLDEGDLFVTLEAGGRLQVLADGITGWVSAGPGEDPWIRTVLTPNSWTTLTGIASNGAGYLAYGMWAELDFPPYEGGFERPLLMWSDDGVAWEEIHEGVPGRVTDVAAGADDWVVLSHHAYGGAFASHTVDGSSWTEPQGLTGSAHAVAHGPTGWVIVGYEYDVGLYARRSADGRVWGESIPLPREGSQPELEASDSGYFLFDRYGPLAMASVDGVSWYPADPSPDETDWIADVELIGQEVLALTVDSDDGATTMHRGRIEDDGSVTWGAPVDPAPFSDMRVDSVSSGPGGVLAFGWDPDALVPAAWTSGDATSWNRVELAADTFGGEVGPEPAWGAGGWVALGRDGTNDALWRSADGAAWSATGGPEPMEMAEPRCPAVDDATVLGLMFLGERAYDCFEGASLAVRGWVPLIEGLGGCCWPAAEPSWLAGPYPTAWLSPAEVDRMTLSLHVPPEVDSTALETHEWVEVVGHFGDPAAESCRHIPTPSFPHRLESQQEVRDDCLRRFVVESIRAVEGP